MNTTNATNSDTFETILTRLAKERAAETVEDIKRRDSLAYHNLLEAIKIIREDGGIVTLREDGSIERYTNSDVPRLVGQQAYPLLDSDAHALKEEGGAEAWADCFADELEASDLVEFFAEADDLQEEAQMAFSEAVEARFDELAEGTPADIEHFPSDCEFDGDTVEEKARAALKHVVLGVREEITVEEACEKAKEIGGTFGSTIKESEEAGERYFWNEEWEELLCIAPVQGAISMLSRKRIMAGWEGYIDPAPSKETIAALIG